MSTHHEQKLVFPDDPLESFIYFTKEKNKFYLTGESDDEIIRTKELDNVRFDIDTDGVLRRKLVDDKKELIVDDLDYYYQVFLLTHLVDPENYRKGGPYSIYNDPTENRTKAEKIKPVLKRSQWSSRNMKLKNNISGVANWIFIYGAEFCKNSYHLLGQGYSLKELLDKSAEIMGWRDNYHLTKTFKEISITRPDLVDGTGEVYAGTYSNFGLKKGFKGKFTQSSLLESNSSIKEILELPYNIEHNLCGWIKWLMLKQEIKF